MNQRLVLTHPRLRPRADAHVVNVSVRLPTARARRGDKKGSMPKNRCVGIQILPASSFALSGTRGTIPGQAPLTSSGHPSQLYFMVWVVSTRLSAGLPQGIKHSDEHGIRRALNNLALFTFQFLFCPPISRASPERR